MTAKTELSAPKRRTRAQRHLGKAPEQLALADLDAPLMLAFLNYLESERHNKVRSRNARFRAIRSFLHFAAFKEPAALPVIQRVLAIPMKRFDKPLLGFLSRAEMQAILDAPDATTWCGHRDRAMFTVFYNTGGRVSEITDLKVADVVLDDCAAVRIRGKGRKQRSVPFVANHGDRNSEVVGTYPCRTGSTAVSRLVGYPNEPSGCDGTAAPRRLEEQSVLAFQTPAEFDLPIEEAAIKLKRQGYSDLFQSAFGEDVNPNNISRALAAYERTLVAGDSPFDRYLFKKETNAISPEAERGFRVFLAAKCDSCHLIMTEGLHPFALKYVVFTDGKFHNLGVDAAKPKPDPGLYAITGNPEDWGRFRTPTLRNIALTAPYFHDGSAATLADVVEFYDKGGIKNRNLDPALRPLNFSAEQKQDLVRFLESLTTSGVSELNQEAQLADKE